MAGSAGLIDYTRTLTAGKEWKLEAEAANYVAIIKAPAGALSFRFDDRAGIERYEGMGTPVPAFRKLVITSAVDQQVTVSVGYVENGAPYDSRPVQFFGSINVNTDVPSSNQSLVDVVILAGGIEQVIPANAGRKTALVQLDVDAVGSVRYGDSAIGAEQGPKMYPGDTLAIDGTAPIYIHNPNGGAVTIFRMVQAR